MTLPDWSFILSHARGAGKTTLMAEACKKAGAVLVCRSSQEAQRVSREFKIKTISLYSHNAMRGVGRIILFDPDAVGLMANDYEAEIELLRAELRKAKEAGK